MLSFQKSYLFYCFAVILILASAPSKANETDNTNLVFNPSTGRWLPGNLDQNSPLADLLNTQKGLIPRELVNFSERLTPGTIVIDTKERRLYHVMEDGKAMRYAIGVGRIGFSWSGTEPISRKSEWPTWTPPAEMRERERLEGRTLPARMEGGPNNPLGARALYLGNTYYRIHGTNQPSSIGQAMSSGCIRLTNEDIIHLYDRTRVGAQVIVRQ